MTIRPDIAEFVACIEVFSKRKLNYPLEVGGILQIAIQTGLTNEFEELIFQAKFLTQTESVMKQIGIEAEGFKNLSMEFDLGLKKSMDLLRILVGRAVADDTQKYSDTFFAMETKSLARLMKLYSDLKWIKNWQIDGKPLPYQTKSKILSVGRKNASLQTKEIQQNGRSIKSLSRIQKSALLTAIFMVLLLLIDPPVTILGWILSLGITVLLAYIVIQILFLTRNQNSH
jgi:hypothetical protein